MARYTRTSLIQSLREMRDLTDRLLEATKRGAFDPCDCHHSSIQHALVCEGPATGYRPCLVAGCDCLHFDDVGQQQTEFLRKTKLAEADAAEYERQMAESLRRAA